MRMILDDHTSMERGDLTMRVYRVDIPHGPFQAIDLPRPKPSAGHALVRVHASAVNPLDTKIRADQAAHARQPLPAVLGMDMAGTVEEVGEGVTAFAPGDDVYGMVAGVGGIPGTPAELVLADSKLLARENRQIF